MPVSSFRLSARAREVNASPSVSLEKGRHRIRAPRIPVVSENLSLSVSRRPQSISAGRNNLYLAVLVSLLAFACLVSFGTAYYLYKSRWSLSYGVDPYQTDEIAQVIEVDPHIEVCPQESLLHRRYLSYLPHSGFHNQRIALENALTLSRILNRTLLIPPARLGSKPLRYVNYDSLYSFVALSGKDNLTHCSKTSLDVPLPLECRDYFDFTILSWEWFFDFSLIRDFQPTIFRWNLTDAWLSDCLNISSSDTRVLRDSSRYHFQFSDVNSITRNGKFSEDLQIDTAASFLEPLLQIGTLFGSSRLHLGVPENHDIRSQIRGNMVLSNPYLLRSAELVAQSLGDSYLGVHVRLGDGQFQADDGAKARSVWWSLVRELGISAEDALTLEKSFNVPNTSYRGNLYRQRLFSGTALQCRGGFHIESHLLQLNVPLYIATDVQQPANNPYLALFFNTFPCSFHLADFPAHLTTLDPLENLYDGLKLKSFLLPFLDAMIVGKASRAIGTPGSTFSTYVTDVLWRKYHNLEVAERG